MDIRYIKDNYYLNVRVAALIIKNGKVLCSKRPNRNYYNIPGGGIAYGEFSNDTAIREIKEEIGLDIKVLYPLGVIESKFNKIKNGEQKIWQEYYFIQRCEITSRVDTNKVLENQEGEDMKYYWLEIDKIDEYEILPKPIKNVIKNNLQVVHILNKEI